MEQRTHSPMKLHDLLLCLENPTKSFLEFFSVNKTFTLISSPLFSMEKALLKACFANKAPQTKVCGLLNGVKLVFLTLFTDQGWLSKTKNLLPRAPPSAFFLRWYFRRLSYWDFCSESCSVHCFITKWTGWSSSALGTVTLTVSWWLSQSQLARFHS